MFFLKHANVNLKKKYYFLLITNNFFFFFFWFYTYTLNFVLHNFYFVITMYFVSYNFWTLSSNCDFHNHLTSIIIITLHDNGVIMMSLEYFKITIYIFSYTPINWKVFFKENQKNIYNIFYPITWFWNNFFFW